LRDEDNFPTMRFLTCPACGHAYTASLTGENACPRCQAPARPGQIPGNRVGRSVQKGHILFTIPGPFHKIQELEELKLHIDSSLEGQPESMAFHFDGASFLDSSMLGQLVRTLQEMTRRGKPTYIVTGDAQVVESLHVLDLDRILTVFSGLAEYRAALA
jgi:anti-anti-sigma regulatory factor